MLLHDAVHDIQTAERLPLSRSQPQHSAKVTNEYDEILLATVQILVRAQDHTYIQLRSLLDQGSQVTLITENAAQHLGLTREHVNTSVIGVGDSPKRGKIQLDCRFMTTTALRRKL